MQIIKLSDVLDLRGVGDSILRALDLQPVITEDNSLAPSISGLNLELVEMQNKLARDLFGDEKDDENCKRADGLGCEIRPAWKKIIELADDDVDMPMLN